MTTPLPDSQQELLAEIDRLKAESERRRQSAAASAASEAVLQKQIDDQAHELDRLRTENETAHRDAYEAAAAGLRLHAAWRSARRRANRVGHLYRQWRPEVDRLRAELATARANTFAEAARVIETLGHSDDAVAVLDNIASGITDYAAPKTALGAGQ